MAKKLDFKDFLNVDYAPGMPGIIKKNAKKRKTADAAGSNAEYSSTNPPRVDEASKPVAPQDLPPASGKHEPGVGMGWTGKHRVIKDKPYKKHVHVFQFTDSTVKEEAEIDEALNPMQRRARARMMKKLKSRIAMGRKRAARRMADMPKLQKRARKAARKLIFNKLTKDVPKDEMTYARRQEIEKRLDTPAMKKRIDTLAKKLLPATRKKEIERKKGS